MIKKIVSNNENILVHRMIIKNNIESIVDYEIKENNIIFDTREYISLEEILNEKIDSQKLLNIIKNILKELKELDVYLISEKNLILDIKHVFIVGDQVKFIVNYSGESRRNFKDLYREIIEKSRINIDSSTVKLIEINNMLNEDRYFVNEIHETIIEYVIKKEENFEKEVTVDKAVIREDKSLLDKIKLLFTEKKSEMIIKENYIK